MRYMLIMRSTSEAQTAAKDIPFDDIINAMGEYNESLIKAGVLLGGEGLTDAKEGFVVDFASTPSVVTDGPYAEAKELFSGFWILETSTNEEAAEWARRCPLGPGSTLEVRRIIEASEFDQDNEHIKREVAWRAENEQGVVAG